MFETIFNISCKMNVCIMRRQPLMINFGQFQGTIFYDLKNNWVSFEDWIGIIVGVLAIRKSEANFVRISWGCGLFSLIFFKDLIRWGHAVLTSWPRLVFLRYKSQTWSYLVPFFRGKTYRRPTATCATCFL